MMKKLLTLALLLLSMASASAQYLVFHVGGGLASHYGGSTRNIGAFKVGAGFEVELSQTLSIEPSLLYYAKGWKDHDLTVPLLDDEGHQLYDDNGNARYGKMNVTTNTNYIVLPVLLNYYLPLGRPHYIVFSAGPYAAYGVGGKQKTKGDTSRSGAERYSYEVDAFDVAGAHRFDAGITAGVSYEFNRQFDAGLQADFGLLNVNRSGGKNFSLVLNLAYRLGL
ncbi:MAG: porin family protein [Prevotellaceae bacterium]|nr:porin family protein [Prevotellaceae bacterium]MDY3856216.1 porin family protein [Bacteroidaceae bacterium]